MRKLKGKYNNDCKVFVNEVEERTIELIRRILDHEITAGVPVRIMPDTHIGKGIVIGFTMPVTEMVNPNYIGVDIGCSVTTHQLNKRIESDKLPSLDHSIRRSIPTGMHIRKKKNYKDWWVEPYFEAVNQAILSFQEKWEQKFGEKKEPIYVNREYVESLCKKIGIKEETFYYSIGTLGGGNHFIEIGESISTGAHFVTIHSGSRHFGLKVCNYHAAKMKPLNLLPEKYHQEVKEIVENTVPKKEIQGRLKELKKLYMAQQEEHLLKGEDMYEYLIDMIIAQTYARYNHLAMTKEIFLDLGKEYEAVESIYSMHNFIDTTDWIIRKGAIRSYAGEKMIIPFNMRDGILICEGKSNPDWNCSAPHGAGRVLSRNKAKETLSMDEFIHEMEGIYSTSICKKTLDESPMAYKDKEVIMDAIQDTAVILDTIKPVMNIKALS